MKRIFEYKNYKKYLDSWIASRAKRNLRGAKTRIAESANCHTAFVSQVLNGNAHFSLEQAEGLNTLFDHTDAESRFFLLLVQHARAGTPGLRKHVQAQIDHEIETANKLQLRLAATQGDTASDDAKALFYSSWIYPAIQLACGIRGLATVEALSRRLSLPREEIKTHVDRLLNLGLLEKVGDELRPKMRNLYLEDRPALIKLHHSNWRLRALESLDRTPLEDLHYSSAISCSKADIPVIREILAQAIQRIRSTVRKSEDEELLAYNVDFFKI